MAMDQLYTDALKELEQVKAERDAAIKRAQVAAGERDSLAASLEKIFYTAVTINPGSSEAEDLQEIYNEAGTALSSVSTSIARLKAQWQDEVLRDCEDYLLEQGVSIGRMHVQEFAALRRQAEPDQ